MGGVGTFNGDRFVFFLRGPQTFILLNQDYLTGYSGVSFLILKLEPFGGVTEPQLSCWHATAPLFRLGLRTGIEAAIGAGS